MTSFVALLRAVNVGGTGKLAMTALKLLCVDAGFHRVETYIASGNVLFESGLSAARVKVELESRLRTQMGKPIAVLVRTASEMRVLYNSNPFPGADPRLVYTFFMDTKPPADATTNIRNQTDEQLRTGRREIYVHYPAGMGQSKLSIPAATSGTARNMNTVAKLVAMSAA